MVDSQPASRQAGRLAGKPAGSQAGSQAKGSEGGRPADCHENATRRQYAEVHTSTQAVCISTQMYAGSTPAVRRQRTFSVAHGGLPHPQTKAGQRRRAAGLAAGQGALGLGGGALGAARALLLVAGPYGLESRGELLQSSDRQHPRCAYRSCSAGWQACMRPGRCTAGVGLVPPVP